MNPVVRGLSLLTAVCLSAGACRHLSMETFDSITGNFSQEFGVSEITPETLKDRLSQKSPTLLIDVRTPQEQSVSILKDAIRVTPEQDLDALPEIEAFQKKYGDREDAMVVVYCAGGYRSARSMSRMQSSPSLSVRNLRGGIIAYANAGGQLQDPAQRTGTDRVHGYNKFWAGFVLDPREATVEPAIPEKSDDDKE